MACRTRLKKDPCYDRDRSEEGVGGHRAAERHLARGLGLGSRIAIALAAFGAAAVVFTLPNAEDAPGGRSWIIWVIGGFFAVLGVACIAPAPIARLAGRVVGASLFAFCIAYVANEVAEGDWFGGDGTTGVVNATLALLAFGLPGAYYAFWGRFRDARETPDLAAADDEH